MIFNDDGAEKFLAKTPDIICEDKVMVKLFGTESDWITVLAVLSGLAVIIPSLVALGLSLWAVVDAFL